MVKLQKIDRANGTCVYSMNIPKNVIDTFKWQKGETLTVTMMKHKNKPVMVVFAD